jgi:signal transduction histidine kinase
MMSMKKINGEKIESFLKSQKKEFIKKWKARVEEVLKTSHQNVQVALNEEEFSELFNVYIEDMIKKEFHRSNLFLVDLIKEKIEHGFLLSTLELINASFMSTARELFRSVYPDAFDKRMEYLERLSQMILNNEVMLAQHYEDYINDLTNQLREKAEILKRHNASLIEFIDVATHQLQTPLWSILGFVSKLQRKYYESIDDYGRHCLNRISANVSDMHQLIEDVTMMLLIDQEGITRKDLYLYDLIEQSIHRVHEEVDKKFSCSYGNSERKIIINGDPQHLKTLFYQIFKNAAQYTVNNFHGEVKLSSSLNKEFHLYIEDNGIGIEQRYRDLVFKPMERLKEKDVSGSGMGLTFAKIIVKGHGGDIYLENGKTMQGICVHIVFPADLVRYIDKKEK